MGGRLLLILLIFGSRLGNHIRIRVGDGDGDGDGVGVGVGVRSLNIGAYGQENLG